MRSFTRRLAAATAAALLVSGVAVPPATAGAGPVVIDDHDSHIPPRAYEISSSTGGTVYGSDDGGFGRLHLSAAPMTLAAPVDLGPRPRTRTAATISGSRVAVPQAGASFDTPVTVVRSCVVGTCPTMTTRTLPAGWRYVGNADDRAIVYHPATNKLGLLEWTGSNAPTNEWTMPTTHDETPTAVGDLTGIALSGDGNVTFVNRTANTVHDLDHGTGAVLTSTSIVWYAVAVGEPSFDETRVYRVLRSTTDANPTPTTVVSLPGAPGIEQLAATELGVAFTIPNGDEEGTNALWTMPYDGSRVLYARPLTTNGLANFEASGNVLVNDRLAGIPGLYSVAPGAYSGSLRGIVPTRGAITHDVAISNGRALYIDDMTANLPMFLRTVQDGVAGPESMFTSLTGGGVGLSGPYVAFTRPGAPGSINVVYGRTDGALTTRSFAASEVGRVEVSGRHALLSGGSRSRVIDIPTGAITDLGRSYAAIFGEYVGLISYDTGAVSRRNLDTGSVQVVRVAEPGCTEFCVDDDNWQMALWGHELVYSFGHSGSSPSVVSGLWNGNTGATTPLSMLSSGTSPLYTEVAYWGGLLLVAHNDATVRLYDMREGAPGDGVLVDGFAEEPFAMDGNVVAWRPLSNLKAVVRDVRDFVPGYTVSPRYLGGAVPAAFGPGTENPTWVPRFLVSQEMTGTLEIREGSASGDLVKSVGLGTLNGEMVGSWDGTKTDASDAPQGTYHWSIKIGGLAPGVLQRASGVSAASGTVYLSRTALGSPALTAPTLSTDVSSTTSIPLSWTVPAGAPAGTRYVLERSINGGAFSTSTVTSATSLSYGGSPGTTYRFRVAAIDPAGRQGTFSAVKTTMVPYHDNAAGTSYAGVWRIGYHGSLYGGSHRYSSTAGSTYTFSATGNAIYLIGARGPGYGQFQVSIDGGAWSGLIDTYATSTQYRKVLFARGLASGPHTIKVRVYGTRGRPYLGIDGVAFRR